MVGTCVAAPNVAEALTAAASITRVHLRLLVTKASFESCFSPTDASRASSARGLFQFTWGTWLDLVERYGPDASPSVPNLGRAALLLQRTPAGKVQGRTKAAEDWVLSLRDDPLANAVMMGFSLREAAARIAKVTGLPTLRGSDLYLAHFLGIEGAMAFMAAERSSPGSPAAGAVSKGAVEANPTIFRVARTGRWRTIAELRAMFAERAASEISVVLVSRVDGVEQRAMAAIQ